ncbi:hypothetical protein D9619_011983 [Psilocybe cf. subviscida]|uniref:Uncharacterized protein n=1 Tax=Psilocybe cf. subviscida TaxID=2480587 RepID=A0A8H5EVX4_9AGAR|nr:hypothetical protein D9619_011983 [Psilocybe cf. subviscida]
MATPMFVLDEEHRGAAPQANPAVVPGSVAVIPDILRRLVAVVVSIIKFFPIQVCFILNPALVYTTVVLVFLTATAISIFPLVCGTITDTVIYLLAYRAVLLPPLSALPTTCAQLSPGFYQGASPLLESCSRLASRPSAPSW